MDEFIWRESYSVHHTKLDSQHKKIFEVLNKMAKHQHEGIHSESISETLTLLREYSDEHLKYEEEILKKINYYDFEAHKQQHKLYKQKIATAFFEIMNEDESVPTKLLTYMRHWWIQHILNQDKRYVRFIQDNVAASFQKL